MLHLFFPFFLAWVSSYSSSLPFFASCVSIGNWAIRSASKETIIISRDRSMCSGIQCMFYNLFDFVLPVQFCWWVLYHMHILFVNRHNNTAILRVWLCKFSLEQAMKTHKGSTGIVLLFL